MGDILKAKCFAFNLALNRLIISEDFTQEVSDRNSFSTNGTNNCLLSKCLKGNISGSL